MHFVNQLTHLFMLSLEGLISEAQNEHLKKVLSENAEARAYYYDFIASHIALNSIETFSDSTHPSSVYLDQEFWKELAAAEKDSPAICLPKATTEVPAAIPVQQAHTVNKLSLVSLIMSTAAILFFVFFARFAPTKESVLVGKLTGEIDTLWETPSGQILPYSDLYVGPLSLKKGFAEIHMSGGALVVFQAPAHFTLESPTQIFLQQGKLTIKIKGEADNPFVVRTPHASVIDYGTEFGVHVDSSDNTLTHVYEGKVELRSGPNPLRFEQRLTLTETQAGRASEKGGLSEQRGIQGIFVRPAEFDIKLKAARGSEYHRWLDYSLQLRKDPDVAAYYSFEFDPDRPDTLVNSADSTFGDLNGQLHSAVNASKPAWCQGRWPQKTALAFDRSQRHYVEAAADARFSINGPITVAAWIYRETADDGGHIVANRISPESICNYQLGYRSDSSSNWQHSIHLARKLRSSDHKNQPYSVKLPDLYGWTLVAATHDNETLKFYLNGRLVDTKHWPRKQELIEAKLLIGSDFISNTTDRFNGIIDEIVIAKRVFTEQEIAEMYESGKPLDINSL